MAAAAAVVVVAVVAVAAAVLVVVGEEVLAAMDTHMTGTRAAEGHAIQPPPTLATRRSSRQTRRRCLRLGPSFPAIFFRSGFLFAFN